jgi:hypothetical protein
METNQLLKFIIGKRFYNTEKLITKWVDESKKSLTLVLYVGKVRVAQIVENTTDTAKSRYVVTSRIPQVRKNLGSFANIEQAVAECEGVSSFFISQLSSEF